MKILLIGEYSRFHNSLKEGLVALGHQVTLVGNGDAFKQYPVDIDIRPRTIEDSRLLTKMRHLIFKLTRIDIAQVETGQRFWRHREQLKGYDVVQLINSWSIRTTVAKELKCIQFLTANNGKLLLSACGTDCTFVESLFSDNLPYNLLTPYFEKRLPASAYPAIFRYRTEPHKKLYTYVIENARAIIPTDMDYFLAYHPSGICNVDAKATTLIPTPINLSKLEYKPVTVEGKIIIFHGINRSSYYKKGNDIFEEALKIVQETHNDRIEIITVESLPYADYIKAYNKAHILLDQVYSHDQGYNALEAMAKGKVVFTGAGQYFKEFYKVDGVVAIDATPDAMQIAQELIHLIEHPERLREIGASARAFVEKHHNHMAISQQYLEIWEGK